MTAGIVRPCASCHRPAKLDHTAPGGLRHVETGDPMCITWSRDDAIAAELDAGAAAIEAVGRAIRRAVHTAIDPRQ